MTCPRSASLVHGRVNNKIQSLSLFPLNKEILKSVGAIILSGDSIDVRSIVLHRVSLRPHGCGTAHCVNLLHRWTKWGSERKKKWPRIHTRSQWPHTVLSQVCGLRVQGSVNGIGWWQGMPHRSPRASNIKTNYTKWESHFFVHSPVVPLVSQGFTIVLGFILTICQASVCTLSFEYSNDFLHPWEGGKSYFFCYYL